MRSQPTPTTTTPSPGTSAPGSTAFLDAQQRVLDAYQVHAERRVVDVPSAGKAQVLVSGEGPSLVMVIGGAVPAAFWAPLMARLEGYTLHAVELPGFGLTEPVAYRAGTVRRTAVDYLSGVLDALGLARADFVTQSMGSQWTTWLSLEHPERVRSQVMMGCPAFFLDTTAIVPFRLASVPGLGRLLMSAQKPSEGSTERIIRAVGEDPAGISELRDVLLAAQRVPAYTPSMVALMRASMRWTRPRAEVVTGAAELRRVEHPVRLVWGRDDTFGGLDSARRMAECIPDADLHILPGGHAPWFHQAENAAALTQEFLAAHV